MGLELHHQWVGVLGATSCGTVGPRWVNAVAPRLSVELCSTPHQLIKPPLSRSLLCH